MDALWPWLAMAGMGAAHGLVPATRGGPAWKMLLPMAAGHGVAMAWVVVGSLAWALGLAGMLVALGLWRRQAAVHAGMALGCFLVSLLHGAGLMLVPALAPLCQGALMASPVLLDALAALAAHLAAMLGVAAVGYYAAAAAMCERSPGRQADRPALTSATSSAGTATRPMDSSRLPPASRSDTAPDSTGPSEQKAAITKL